MFMGMCGEEEVGGPGASPMGPGPRGPPAPPSPAKSEEKQGQSVAAESGAVNIDLWHFWSSIKRGGALAGILTTRSVHLEWGVS